MPPRASMSLWVKVIESFIFIANVSLMPVPAMAWLFGSALMMVGVALCKVKEALMNLCMDSSEHAR